MKRYVFVGVTSVFCAAIAGALAGSSSVCDSSSTFYSHAKKLTSWSDYQNLMTKCTVEGFKGSDNNPFRAFSDSELNNLFSCVFKMTFDQLQQKCTLAKHISYEGNSSAIYQKELLLQDGCALATASSIVAGQSYMQVCLEKLGLKK